MSQQKRSGDQFERDFRFSTRLTVLMAGKRRTLVVTLSAAAIIIIVFGLLPSIRSHRKPSSKLEVIFCWLTITVELRNPHRNDGCKTLKEFPFFSKTILTTHYDRRDQRHNEVRGHPGTKCYCGMSSIRQSIILLYQLIIN